jgi:membrane protease YdiL (CAAX protease family)
VAFLLACVRRSPVITFFVLAYACTWMLLPFAGRSIVVSLLALMGPAVAAVTTAALCGRDVLDDLRTRTARWRVPVRWYVLALAMPLPISAFRTGIEFMSGAAGPIHWQTISALGLMVFVLVAGEEIGWRGFALPRLLARLGPWTASVTVGLLWAMWHLPLFYMAGMPQSGTPFLPYIIYVIGLSMILTFLGTRTGGSVVIATVFHGAVNTFGIVNGGATALQRGWGNALSYGVVALALGAVAWRRWQFPMTASDDETTSERMMSGRL